MSCYFFNTKNNSVLTKLATIYGQNCTLQAFCCKTNAYTTLQLRMSSQLKVACTRAFQLICTTADQSDVGSYFDSCSLCFFFAFFLFVFFYKIRTEEHSNLHNATLLRRFGFYVGENSRTFQDRIVEFKDFSRIFGNPRLFKDLL